MHTLTWLAWLVAAFAATLLAPGPLYLCLILLAAVQVFLAWRGDAPLARSFGLFVRAGAYICAGYVLFSVVTVGGARGATVLLDLPAIATPAWLGGVVLGGPVTAEALAWGVTRGLAIWTLMVVFGAFNALVDHHRLLRLTPPALFHAGLAVTIAVAFVPSLLRAVGEIGQAQRARGHRFGGLRTLVPLVSPLLAGSLEQAIQLAEALDARGYGRSGARLTLWRQAALILGVPLLGAGLFVWLYRGASGAWWVVALVVAGGACLTLAVRALNRGVVRSSYRRERWRRRDGLAVGACAVVVAILGALRLAGAAELVYYPFPRLVAPGFDLRAGLALLLLATPAAVAGREPPPRVPRQRTRRSETSSRINREEREGQTATSASAR